MKWIDDPKTPGYYVVRDKNENILGVIKLVFQTVTDTVKKTQRKELFVHGLNWAYCSELYFGLFDKWTKGYEYSYLKVK